MQRINERILAGCEYLISKQNPQGYWSDFELPVGSSDAWVTAFVALSMTYANVNIQSRKITVSVRRAIYWLVNHRDYAQGWGYNRITGADADTTSYVLTLLRENNLSINCVDKEYLAALQCKCGGFSTYSEKTAWGLPHPDVTPVAVIALAEMSIMKSKPVASYLLNNQMHPGFWPSYWWKNCFYSSYHNFKLCIDLDIVERPKELNIPKGIGFSIESSFDLAWLTALASCYSDKTYTMQLSKQLTALQHPEGYWHGSTNLRVTDPACSKPWISSKGQYYVDFFHSITTASSIWALSLL